MKFFNTVGVINPENHYFLPHRLDWDLLTSFIEKQYYFIPHAPRQSGKTTAIIEFTQHLNQERKYTALYLSTKPAHAAVNNINHAIRALLVQFKEQIEIFLPSEEGAYNYLSSLFDQTTIDDQALYSFLHYWSKNSSKPLVLFFDEFDGLMGDSLITLLKQFRSGYTNRPRHFPQSICLIGVRDLRDYKIRTKQQEELGVLYSPFNIKAESLLLPNFSQEDVATLYRQHTTETGQQFTDEALEYAFEQTQGQPWLVNALAYQACFRDPLMILKAGKPDPSKPVTLEVMQRAREALIARRDTHLDALVDRLKEPRVRTIIDALISGTEPSSLSDDDLQYVRDLGLISQRGITITNPIYQEIVPRALTYVKQEMITQKSSWYQNNDRSLNMIKLLEAFTLFFQENSEIWLERFDYKESGPHLLMMAFLQRVINGGGSISREYALGRKRLDLLVIWHHQRIAIELKILRGKNILEDGLKQTAEYMDKSAATEGHLVIFDSTQNKTWDEKIYHTQEIYGTKKIDVWGL